MRDININELGKQSQPFFDLVSAGETLRVIQNGKPIADIQPIHRTLPSWKQRVPQPLVLDETISASRLILEERDS